MALNSLKPATPKDREQEILLFPVFHRFPVPQTSPARTTAGTVSQRKAINVPCPVILPNKSFWKGWGELEGGRETFFQKGFPSPLIPELPPALPDLLETLGAARTGQVGP
ncbi:hypothetical protein, partial [uncultured Desulfovibrio sp.]|uniref:hypothetical protein n=1 Tax=uncultured Desulfovibrio sp. TaxID=167968 RepID=UPI00261F960E